jgi:flagellar biosynthetic protein FliR
MIFAEPQLLLLGLYFFVSLRFLGVLTVAPAFAASAFPIQVRLWLAFLLALFALPAALELPSPEPILTIGGLVTASTREYLLGAALGFFGSLPLYALQMAGRIVGMQMSFGMANVLDPFSEVQVSVVEQFKFLAGLWFFFHWNGHLLLVRAAGESLRLAPLGVPSLAFPLDPGLGLWMQRALVLAMRMVLPFFGALLLADVGLGFVARTVPQMNIFVLGLPLKVALGFFLLMVVLPMSIDLIHGEVERVVETALGILQVWR